MKLRTILKQLKEEYDYRGQHTAPDKESGCPAYDLTLNDVYPDDIYSSKAIQYYGTGEPTDRVIYSILSSCRNRPNMVLTVYRALPDPNYKSKNKLSDINNLISYVESYGFPPIESTLGKKIKIKGDRTELLDIIDKFGSDFNYKKDSYLDYLYSERNKIRDSSTKPLQINPGDWVAITKKYADDHRAGEIGWTTISKKVKAKEIYTNGDSWDEWGYDPS